jgi:hypothetical protein
MLPGIQPPRRGLEVPGQYLSLDWPYVRPDKPLSLHWPGHRLSRSESCIETLSYLSSPSKFNSQSGWGPEGTLTFYSTDAHTPLFTLAGGGGDT